MKHGFTGKARRCSECARYYLARAPNQASCSQKCNTARARRLRVKHPERVTPVASKRIHVFVAAADTWEPVIRKAPEEEWPERIWDAHEVLVKQEGPQFAGVIAFALRERLGIKAFRK